MDILVPSELSALRHDYLITETVPESTDTCFHNVVIPEFSDVSATDYFPALGRRECTVLHPRSISWMPTAFNAHLTTSSPVTHFCRLLNMDII